MKDGTSTPTTELAGWLEGGGEMARRIREHPWADTALGPIEDWPQSLKTAVDMILAMPGPATILWGPQNVQLYNDAYIAIARDRHPLLLGRPVAEGWPEAYEDVIAPLLDAAHGGRSSRLADFPVALHGLDGRSEERVFDTDWSPIRDESGAVAGALQTLTEVTERHRAQAVLRESEARNRLLIESWAQALWETDPDGVVVADSPSWRAYTGQTVEQWLGYGWLDAIHPDDRALAERQWRAGGEGHHPVDAEFRLRSADGGWRWTNVRAAPVLDAQGNIEKWAGMNIDIDARKRAESAVAESEAKYRTLFETMGQGYCELELIRDANGRAVDQRYIQFNPAFERLFNAPVAEAKGRKASEVFPELESFWTDAFDQVVKEGRPKRVEHELKEFGRWFEVFAYPAGGDRLVVLYEDVSDRKRGEIALGQSEERQRFLLTLGDAMREKPTAEAKIETAAKLLGERLKASRVLWGEYDWDNNVAYVFNCWFADGAQPFPTVMQLQDYAGEVLNDLKNGRVVRLDNVGLLRSEPAYAAIADVGIHALLSLPLLIDGKLKVNLSIHQHEPREWTDDEVALVTEVAERLWAEVVRTRAEAARRESEERYRTLFETIDEGFTIMEAVRDEAGRVVDVIYRQANQAWARLFGHEIELGRRASELFAYPADAPWIETWNQVLETGEPIREEQHVVSTDRWYNVRFSRIGDPGSNLIAAVFDDITERKVAERDLRESEERKAFLLRFSDALRGEPNVDAVANQAIQMLAEQMGLDRCYITFYRPAGDEAVFPYQIGNDKVPRLPDKVRLSDFPQAYEQVLEKTLVIEDDFERRGLSEAEQKNSKQLGMRAMIASTVRRGSANPICSMTAVSGTPRRWTPGEIALVEQAAERTWAAMERARSETALRESEGRLADDLEATEVLREIGNKLISKPGVNGHFSELCAAARALMRSDCASIQEYDEASARLKLVGHVGFEPDSAASWEWVDAGVGSSCGRALAKGERVIVPDMDLFDADASDLEAYRRSGILSVQSTPLVARTGQVVGMMSTHWHQRDVPAEASYRFFDLLARLAADFIVRIRAEAALRESEDRLRGVLDAMGEGFALFDADFAILDVNDETLRLDGRKREELVGQSHWDAFPETEHSPVGKMYKKVMRDRTPGAMEHVYHWPDGRQMWVDVRAYPTDEGGVAVFWSDITDRKVAAEALKQSEERYRSLFESMDEAYAVVDVLKDDDGEWCDFRFVEVNPAFVHHTNMPPPVGKTATELLGTPNPRWTELYGQALDTGEALRVEEGEATLGLTFDLNIFVLDREKNRVAVLFTNITERKQAEEALRRSERHANTLLAELQHRVRNTLAVVRSIARRTAENTTTVDNMLAHFQGRLDAFSRVQAALTRNPDAKVDLASLIEDELVAHAAREGQQVRIDGPAISLEPRTAERLSLAIHELTTNAVKHGALVNDRGRIEISWSKRSNGKGPELLMCWKETGVEVADEKIRREGFGMELLRRSLPYDLSAETAVELERTGLRFELRMQLAES